MTILSPFPWDTASTSTPRTEKLLSTVKSTASAKTGPLPADHIPAERTFRSADCAIRHFQRAFVHSTCAPLPICHHSLVLECPSLRGTQIRIVINDGVTPLTGIRGCPEQADDMCPIDTFVVAQKEPIKSTDRQYACHEDWEAPSGLKWETATGDPSKPK